MPFKNPNELASQFISEMPDGSNIKWYMENAKDKTKVPIIKHDMDSFNKALNDANAQFPNDWMNKMDYLKQTLGLDYGENIADLKVKDNMVYGLETYPEGEPREIPLYRLGGK